MKVISVVNEKGGVGKTTISIHLADQFSRMGYDVLLIDADPQQSAMDWSNFREEGTERFAVAACASAKLHKNIASLGKGHDIVIIDGVPRSTDLTRSAISASDLALIPVEPSTFDLIPARATAGLVDGIRRVREENGIDHPVDAVAVVNRVNRSTRSAGEIRGAIETMAMDDDGSGERFPVLETSIGNRILFSDVIPEGKTVMDADPDGAAAKEIAGVATQILERLGMARPATI